MIGEVTGLFHDQRTSAPSRSRRLNCGLRSTAPRARPGAKYTSHNGKGWQATIVTDDKEQDLAIPPFQPDWIARHNIDVIVDKVKPIVTAEDALRVHKIVDAAYKQTGMLKK